MNEADRATRTATAAHTNSRTFTADHLLSPAWTGSDILLTTTDGLNLLIKGASLDGEGRIKAMLLMDPATAKERSDLTTIDGCAVDFAPSTPLDQAIGFNCRVFARKGHIGFLRFPGIQHVRPAGQ